MAVAPPSFDGGAVDRLARLPDTRRSDRPFVSMRRKTGVVPLEAGCGDKPPCMQLRIGNQRLIVHFDHDPAIGPPLVISRHNACPAAHPDEGWLPVVRSGPRGRGADFDRGRPVDYRARKQVISLRTARSCKGTSNRIAAASMTDEEPKLPPRSLPIFVDETGTEGRRAAHAFAPGRQRPLRAETAPRGKARLPAHLRRSTRNVQKTSIPAVGRGLNSSRSRAAWGAQPAAQCSLQPTTTQFYPRRAD